MKKTGIWELVCWRLGRRRKIRIEGDSMIPTLCQGDQVLVAPTRIRVGAIVLVRHPYRIQCEIVKRVSSIDPDGGLVLIGDNPCASTDSRSFGAVPPTHYRGTVTSRIPQSDC